MRIYGTCSAWDVSRDNIRISNVMHGMLVHGDITPI
jgi:hypothetical protein